MPDSPQGSLPFAVHSFTVPGGLKVILIPDAAAPTVALDLSYGVGSKNDPRERTGLAHFYEHMMFEGSANHTSNFIQKVESRGGRVNGGTSRDRTQYWSIVPPEALEELLAMEADRMRSPNLDPISFEEQKGIITNERLEKYDNAPFGLAIERFHQLLYGEEHPYHAPVIGSLPHIQQTSLEDLKAFTQKYYHPGNACLAIAGPIAVAECQNLIHRLFADIPAHDPVPAPVIPLNHGLNETLFDDVAYPKSYIGWHTAAAFSEDDAAYDVLSHILSQGRGQLLSHLNRNQPQVHDVRAMQVSRQHAGLFRVDYIPHEKATANLTEQVSASIKSCVDAMQEADLEQAKGQLRLQELLPLARSGGFGGLVDALNFFGTLTGQQTDLFSAMDRFRHVNLSHVKACAEKLTVDNATCLQVKVGPKPKTPLQPQASSAQKPAPTKGPASLPVYRPEPSQLGQTTSGFPFWQVHKPRQPLQSLRLCWHTAHSPTLVAKPFLARYLEQIVGRRFHVNPTPFGHIAAKGGDAEVRVQANVADLGLLVPQGTAPSVTAALRGILETVDLPQAVFHSLQEDFQGRLRRMQGNKEFLLEQTARQLILGPDHEANMLRFPTPQDLAELKASDVLRAWEELQTAPAFGIACGPDRAEVVEDTFGKLGLTAGQHWPGLLEERPHNADQGCSPMPLTFVGHADASQGSQVELNFLLKTAGLNAGTAEQAKLVIVEDALAGGFGNRIERALRKLGPISYGVKSGLTPYKDWGVLNFSFSVPTEFAPQASAVVLQELQALSEGFDTFQVPETTAAAQHYLTRSFPSFETAQNHSAKLRQLLSLGLPVDHFTKLWTAVRELAHTPEEIQKCFVAMWQRGLVITVAGELDQALPKDRPYQAYTTTLGENFQPLIQDL